MVARWNRWHAQASQCMTRILQLFDTDLGIVKLIQLRRKGTWQDYRVLHFLDSKCRWFAGEVGEGVVHQAGSIWQGIGLWQKIGLQLMTSI